MFKPGGGKQRGCVHVGVEGRQRRWARAAGRGVARRPVQHRRLGARRADRASRVAGGERAGSPCAHDHPAEYELSHHPQDYDRSRQIDADRAAGGAAERARLQPGCRGCGRAVLASGLSAGQGRRRCQRVLHGRRWAKARVSGGLGHPRPDAAQRRAEPSAARRAYQGGGRGRQRRADRQRLKPHRRQPRQRHRGPLCQEEGQRGQHAQRRRQGAGAAARAGGGDAARRHPAARDQHSRRGR